MIKEIQGSNRNILMDLFETCPFDRVLIDSVLEGNFGRAYALFQNNQIQAARLDSGAFTIFAGNTNAEGIDELLRIKPIFIVTPQNQAWDLKLSLYFEKRAIKIPFTRFDSSQLDPEHLQSIVDGLCDSYQLKALDNDRAKKALSDLENEYLFENFHSISDFLDRGIGFCILDGEKVIGAATSMAISKKAIDIEIQTHKDYRRQGLASVVGSQLLLTSLDKGLDPIWLAANLESEKLATKLGYKKIDTYESICIED